MPEKLRTSRLVAKGASNEAEAAWRRLRVAIETDGPVAAAGHELLVYVAGEVCAWAVYHATAQDASSDAAHGWDTDVS